MDASTLAAYAVTLLFAHFVADYWVQSHHQATIKGHRGRAGSLACLKHVATYTLVTAALGGYVWAKADLAITPAGFIAGQMVSAVTHYWADRRYTLAGLAKRLGKQGYYDNGGAEKLDQAWHIGWLFIAALITADI